MKNVMPAMKYQLPAMFIFQSGASSCAAGSVMPSSSASSWPGSRFAENPPATPANDAAMPTIGCRPAAAYKAPASGIMTTKAASAAWLAMTDTKMTIGVSQAVGAPLTAARIAAPASPVRSARPAPSITSST